MQPSRVSRFPVVILSALMIGQAILPLSAIGATPATSEGTRSVVRFNRSKRTLVIQRRDGSRVSGHLGKRARIIVRDPAGRASSGNIKDLVPARPVLALDRTNRRISRIELASGLQEAAGLSGVVYRVDVGGPGVPGENGWSADTRKNPSPYLRSPNAQVDSSSATLLVDETVPQATPVTIFSTHRQHVRTANVMWSFPVTPGVYEVNLYFAELDPRIAAGSRLLDIYGEGSLKINDLDVVANAGANTGTMRSFAVSSDSKLDINISAQAGAPEVAGVEVLQLGGTPTPTPTPAPTPTPTPAPTPTAPNNSLYGPAEGTCPGSSVIVSPGQSIQAAIDSKATGTTFCIKAGEYRITQTLRPRASDVLVFEPGAVLNGSKLVANWSFDGTYWVSGGQTQSFPAMGGVPCDMNAPACEYEDLFMDDRPMTRVLSLGALAPGKFYFDEAADKMYIVDDPTGHEMEAPVVGTGIEASGVAGVTIRGVTLEKLGLHGIVTGNGWALERNEVRWVHSHGLRVFGLNSRVTNNFIHHAGTMGIFGEGTNLLFDTNRIAYNNYLNFGKTPTDYWHAGGTKIVKSDGTVVRNNWSHDNLGDGWWFDWDNVNTLVENNVFENNKRFGVLYEASFKAVFRNNVLRGNGIDQKWGGAGIWVSTSKDVEIYDNIFDSNKYSTLAFVWTSRGSSTTYGERQTSNMFVHGNTFKFRSGFVGVPYGDTRVYSANNRFENNRYEVGDTALRWWNWQSGMKTWSEWRSYGKDINGTIAKI